MSINMEWIPRKNGEGSFLDECCTKTYVEYSPSFGFKDGFQCLKKDGSICDKHRVTDDNLVIKDLN